MPPPRAQKAIPIPVPQKGPRCPEVAHHVVCCGAATHSLRVSYRGRYRHSVTPRAERRLGNCKPYRKPLSNLTSAANEKAGTISCRYASRDTSIGVRCTDCRNTRVQSKRRCLRNPGGNRNNMPRRRMVPRTQGRVRRWGRTHIVRFGPVRVRQFLTPPAHL